MGYGILASAAFWLILAALGLFAWKSISKIVGKIPLIGNKQGFMLACLIGFFVFAGGAAMLGVGSIAGPGVSDVVISNVQETTTFASVSEGSVAASSVEKYTWDVRGTDAQFNETSGITELDTGILTVTRSGSLDPVSCPVVCYSADYTSETSPGDGNIYNILEKTTLGEIECYLNDGGAATTASAKESTMLTFADGTATRTLGVALEVDEDGHDVLNQYSYRTVTVDICGQPVYFRVHAMD